MQFGEILGLPPNIPCLSVGSDMLMGPQSSDRISHEDKPFFSEYEFNVPGNEIPNWFNHQSVRNFVSFWIGPKFPTIALCLAFGKEDACCHFYYQVEITVNGRKRLFERTHNRGMRSDHLSFSCRPQNSLQKQFQDLNLGDRNHVELFSETFFQPFEPGKIAPIIKRMAVHVECICPPPPLHISGIFHDSYEGIQPVGSNFSLDQPDLGIDSSNGDGFDSVSSQLAHPFVNDDSNFNLYPLWKKLGTLLMKICQGTKITLKLFSFFFIF